MGCFSSSLTASKGRSKIPSAPVESNSRLLPHSGGSDQYNGSKVSGRPSPNPDSYRKPHSAAPDALTIAVMGPTGTGKTSFIYRASGTDLGVGHSVYSSTKTVQVTPPFELDGFKVQLIDTPGFDDTNLSDAEVLSRISAYLAEEYKEKKMLAGVVYIYRISDVRMGGISQSNFRTFRRLCGESSLHNTVIATSRWSDADLVIQEQREAELRDSPDFFKPAIDKGAKLCRHLSDTTVSAHEILRMILRNHPKPIRIQVEMVDQKLEMSQTDAAGELEHKFQQEKEKHRKEIVDLEEEMREAISKKDEETTKEIENERRQREKVMAQREEDLRDLNDTYRRALEAEKAERQKEFNHLEAKLKNYEEQETRRKAAEAEARWKAADPAARRKAETLNIGQTISNNPVTDGMALRYNDIGSSVLAADLLQSLDPVRDAMFDSIGTISGCMPGTRQEVIDRIVQWVDGNNNKPICWLYAAAGAGKSAISITVAELFATRNKLGGSYSFLRGTGRRNKVANLVSTLAYQLALSVPATRPYIETVLQREPHIAHQSLEQQLRKLIMEPILSLGTSISRLVIVIDALDECDDKELIANFINIIAGEFPKYQLPLRFLFTSRVEDRIQRMFSTSPVLEGTYTLALHDFSANQDIRTFFRSRFEAIYQENRRLMGNIPLPWPSEAVLNELVKKSDQSFIYASTLVKFVNDASDHPHRKLATALETHDQALPAP